MLYSKDEINSLLIAIKANPHDKESFDRLYKKLSKPILFVAKKHLKGSGNRHDAEDIVGNTFVTVLSKIDSLRMIKNGSAWIFKIAENLCKMLKRSRQREILTDKIEVLSNKDFATNTLNEIVLGEILQQLTEEERAIIILHEETELTYNEIAKVLKISTSTVKRRVERIKERFKVYNE